MTVTFAAFSSTAPEGEPKLACRLEAAHEPDGAGPMTGASRMDPDAALIARVQTGDVEVFEDVIARHNRRVYRTLMAILGNAEEERDAMQDTFLKAFQHIDDFQYRSKFSTWLLTIASNTALQRLRERKRLECLDDSGEAAESRPRQTRARNADPEQLYSQTERRRLVESGLKKMPSKYRAALVLRDIEQLSAEEAASKLGLGVPALKARLFRARLMLRALLVPHFAKRVTLSKLDRTPLQSVADGKAFPADSAAEPLLRIDRTKGRLIHAS